MNEYLKLEIMVEVAWQLGDSLPNSPRAESRWQVVDIAKDIFDSGFINENSENIDELVDAYLTKEELK